MKKKLKALVTGSTRGIGLSIGESLLESNINVISTGTGESPYSKEFEYYPIDFNDQGALKEFLEFIKKSQLDILINNAGINKIDRFEDIEIEDFNKIINVNLTVPFQICQAVIPYMKKQRWGRIVNIASIWSKISREHRASYSSSKFGLEGMTLALSAELSKYGILANCVSPGFTKTDLTERILGVKEMDKVAKSIPVGRLGETDEIAKLVNWLVSDSNTYLTGQNIMIDGGFSSV